MQEYFIQKIDINKYNKINNVFNPLQFPWWNGELTAMLKDLPAQKYYFTGTVFNYNITFTFVNVLFQVNQSVFMCLFQHYIKFIDFVAIKYSFKKIKEMQFSENKGNVISKC